MKLMKTLGALLLLFATISCDNDKSKRLHEFKLRVLNEQGEETTTFSEGENVIFSFLVINKTDEDAYFYHTKMNLDHFFEVYKLNTAEGDISLGKPYKYIFCEKIGALRVPANDSLDITVPWIFAKDIYRGYNGCESAYSESPPYHNITFPLTKGNYKTGFSSSFKLNDLETEVMNLEVKFTIN